MTRLGDAASYDTVEAETKDIAGILVRVATPRALYCLKRGTARAKDREDAAAPESASIWRLTMSRDRRVQKFRSGEAMNAAAPASSDSNFDRFLRHCSRHWMLAP